jgi:hypothetical protein
MAIRFAKQAGNWSDPLTWDDGLTIPTTGDEVYLNNYNITINQDVTTGFISNSQTPIGVPLDPIPDMTSNTSPVGVGQAFATQNSVTAWKAFRKGLNTVSLASDGWTGFNMTGQLGFQFGTSKIIKRYSWYNNQAAGNRPKSWTFEGSNDGVIWVILDTIVNAASTTNYNSSILANTTSYTYYRINVTATQGSTSPCIINSLNMTESTSLGDGYLSGGTATIPASRTVNANLFHATGSLITISAASPNVVNIIGNMPGTKAGFDSRGVSITNNCTLNYVGNIFASTILIVRDPRGITTSAASTINITGDIYGGSNFSTDYGDNNGKGVSLSNGAVLNVVGNITGGINYWNKGVAISSNNVVTITGNVTGGVGTNISGPCIGVQCTVPSSIPVDIIGNISSGPNSYGVMSLSTTPIKVTGNLQNSSIGLTAVYSPFLFLESTNMNWQFRKYDLTTNTLYTPGVATGFPATTNVRTGTLYGPTSNLTGTCAVPPAAAVSLGVPVDNTVGTAQLDTNALAASLTATLAPALDASLSVSLDASLSASLPAAIAPLLWDEAVTNITTPNSIGERLKNCSTVATTGAQIASFNP